MSSKHPWNIEWQRMTFGLEPWSYSITLLLLIWYDGLRHCNVWINYGKGINNQDNERLVICVAAKWSRMTGLGRTWEAATWLGASPVGGVDKQHCHVIHWMSPVFGHNMVTTDDSEKLSAEYQWKIQYLNGVNILARYITEIITVHPHHSPSEIPVAPALVSQGQRCWSGGSGSVTSGSGATSPEKLELETTWQLFAASIFSILLQTDTSCSWLLKAKALIGRELGPLDEAFEDLRLPLEEDRLGGPGPSWEKSAFQTPGHHRSGYKII